MKIPKQVKVGGHILDVIITNDGDLVASDTIGTTVVAKNVIYLNSNYPQSRLEEALLHEIIHNCLFDLQEEQDEALVTRLGTMMYAVLEDNDYFCGKGDPDATG
jgi:hypothetical protein